MPEIIFVPSIAFFVSILLSVGVTVVVLVLVPSVIIVVEEADVALNVFEFVPSNREIPANN